MHILGLPSYLALLSLNQTLTELPYCARHPLQFNTASHDRETQSHNHAVLARERNVEERTERSCVT